MPNHASTHQASERRKHRTRVRLSQNIETPRLTVYRSLRHISAQIIDDKKGITIASAHDRSDTAGKTKTELAQAVGAALAAKAKSKKVSHVRFDKGPYKYHGRIAALAEAARTAGLEF